MHSPLISVTARLDPSSVPVTTTCFAFHCVTGYIGGGLYEYVPPMLLPLFTIPHAGLTTVVGTHNTRIVKKWNWSKVTSRKNRKDNTCDD